MLIGNPCFLIWMRIGASGWEPTGRSFRLCGLRASTHAWKNTTERAQFSSCLAHLPISRGVKMAAGAALSKVGLVGRDKNFFNLEAPPHCYTGNSLCRDGGAHNTLFLGVGCDSTDLWCGLRAAPTLSISPGGRTESLQNLRDGGAWFRLALVLPWSILLFPLSASPSPWPAASFNP